jgi:hypothetical protein
LGKRNDTQNGNNEGEEEGFKEGKSSLVRLKLMTCARKWEARKTMLGLPTETGERKRKEKPWNGKDIKNERILRDYSSREVSFCEFWKGNRPGDQRSREFARFLCLGGWTARSSHDLTF